MNRTMDKVYDMRRLVDKSRNDLFDTVDRNHKIVLRRMTSLQCYVENMVGSIERIFGKFGLSILESKGRRSDVLLGVVREIKSSMKEDWEAFLMRVNEEKKAFQEEMKEDVMVFQHDMKEDVEGF